MDYQRAYRFCGRSRDLLRQVTAPHVGAAFTDRALLLCNGYGDVVYRKSPLPEKIFAHVGQSGCRVDCVSSHAIPF